MYRRLFFLLPSREETHQAIQQLEGMGIDETDIHTFAADEQLLTDLPKATERQKRGLDLLLEKILWETDLSLFFIALAGFITALLYGSMGWAALALTVMASTFAAGYIFTTRIPKVHLNEFKGSLGHHEILLSVDVPPKRVAMVEQMVRRGHPEVVDGGVGWSLHRFGL